MPPREMEVTDHYAQQDRLKGERHFELLEGRYLRVQYSRFRQRQNYNLELALLDPEFEHIDDPAIQWLGALAVVTLAAFPPLGYLYFHFNLQNLLGTLTALLLLTAMGALFFFLYRLNSIHSLVFRTRTARIPLVEILNHKRFRHHSIAFAEQIASHASQSLKQLRVNDEQLRAGELRMLRRLSNEGQIAAATYEQAKRHILTGAPQ